jgi:hypothetical protein
MTSMLSHVWTPKVKKWHGLNGVTLTCHGINQNSGLAIFLKMGEQNSFYKLIASSMLSFNLFPSSVIV